MSFIISLPMFPLRFVLKIPRSKRLPLDYLKNKNINSISFRPITHNEVEDIILALKNAKFIEPLSIPVKLLRLLRSIAKSQDQSG